MKKSKQEKREAHRRSLMMAIDYLEQRRERSFWVKEVEELDKQIQALNHELKTLNKS